MNESSVVVTGANGGIGKAMCQSFTSAGWRVIATDFQDRCDVPHAAYVQIDLFQFCVNPDLRVKKLREIASCCEGRRLNALINNAAVQILGKIEDLTADQWQASLNVNLVAPFLLVQGLLPELESAKGSVVNVGSIHAQLTKPMFAAYATSKAAISGLTRSLAVELGGRIRVNAICPAAISTQMLLDGFKDRPEKFKQLEAVHPSGRIGTPDEIAEAALFLCGKSSTFIHGSLLAIDGGIGARLHDPL